MVFPVVMYGCESWTIKKAESQRIDAFELWCWRKLLRVPCERLLLNHANTPGFLAPGGEEFNHEICFLLAGPWTSEGESFVLGPCPFLSEQGITFVW